MLVLEYFVPCILHMENRVGEENVITSLNENLINLQKKKKAEEAALLKAFAYNVNQYVTNGVEKVPGQWEILLWDD